MGIILSSYGFKTKYLDGALKMLQSLGFFEPRNYWESDQEGNVRQREIRRESLLTELG